MMSNIQRKKIALNVRRDGLQPSIFVRSFGAITMYAIGIMMWVMYISGWYVRKLVRTFELNIQPFHPD